MPLGRGRLARRPGPDHEHAGQLRHQLVEQGIDEPLQVGRHTGLAHRLTLPLWTGLHYYFSPASVATLAHLRGRAASRLVAHENNPFSAFGGLDGLAWVKEIGQI